ncbi:hypothetical protein [Polynucleobacter sp. AP-Latsch-80-C2]|jgi:hypothetical protein|nr:hypothetical protein [Polynucleobacter sp. AP-Latsch-80-C2]MBU3624530.1 hypothetical protein [Polynucleobacter sp. AP-Latsch-80-C2]
MTAIGQEAASRLLKHPHYLQLKRLAKQQVTQECLDFIDGPDDLKS